VYISFAAGLAYYATQVFQAVGLSVAQGWYLTLLIPVEFLLIVAGRAALWGKSWWVPVYFLQLIFVLFMVYSEVFRGDAVLFRADGSRYVGSPHDLPSCAAGLYVDDNATAALPALNSDLPALASSNGGGPRSPVFYGFCSKGSLSC
jgi:hypothetical protein